MLVASVLAVACATLPEPSRPPFEDHRIRARFDVGDDGRLPVPTTSRVLIVYELAFEPAPLAERFDDSGRRWFVFRPGAAVQLRARIRSYQDAGATLRDWLDGAAESSVETP